MNFQEFYHKTEQRLTDAILSLWATGDKEMQDYFGYLISQETYNSGCSISKYFSLGTK